MQLVDDREHQIVRVPREAVGVYRQEVGELMEKYPELWEHLQSIDSVWASLEADRMQLWTAFDKSNKLVLAAMTEVRQFPVSTVCLITWIAGSEFFTDIMSLGISAIEEFAARADCDYVYIEGRRAWERVMQSRGYEFSHVTVRKSIRKERAN